MCCLKLLSELVLKAYIETVYNNTWLSVNLRTLIMFLIHTIDSMAIE